MNDLVVANETSVEPHLSIDELKLIITKMLMSIAKADQKIGMARIECGRTLLELRRRIEDGEVGDLAAVDWWGWYEDNFTRSRRDAERLMAIASAEDPVAAYKEQGELNAIRNRAYRERQREQLRLSGVATSTTGPASNHDGTEFVECKPEPELIPPAPKPQRRSPEAADDAELLEQLKAILLRLSWAGLREAGSIALQMYERRRIGR
jgi:hypothetical protein